MSADRKAPRMRGLRNVSTVQTQVTRSKPGNRSQAVSRFARLENERMRVLRELDAWNARKAEAERMLAKVNEELAIMQALLLDPPSDRPQPMTRPRRRHATAAADTAPADRAHAHIDY